jgi:hypothetical protein
MSLGDASRVGVRIRLADRKPSEWYALAALCALLVAGGWLLLYESRGTTFFQDEWNWILTRRNGGIGSFLRPHNQHLSLVPVAIYKLLFATAGLRHYWPYRACLTAAQLMCVTLLVVYARRRVGSWVALLAAALILVFGPGWQDILWPFQIGWVIAIDAGIGALIALDRASTANNLCACGLLAVSLASGAPGIAVAAGMIVEVLWQRPRRDLWIVVVPVALYAIWWVGYQQASLLAGSLPLVPRFVLDSAAGVLSSLTGLAQIDVATDTGTYLDVGPALVLGFTIGAVWWARVKRPGARLLALAVIPLTFWTIVGVGRAKTRVGDVVLSFTGDEGRYLYVGAIWTVLVAVELARGLRPKTWVLGLLTLATAAAAVSNVGTLLDGGALLRAQAQITRTELGTLDMTRTVVAPSFASNGFIFFAYVTARNYFAAEHQLGTPAATPAQIAVFPDTARSAADSQLIRIHNPTLAPSPTDPRRLSGSPPQIDSAGSGTYSVHSACLRWRGSGFRASTAASAVAVVLPARGLLVQAVGAPASIAIRRFSAAFHPLGTLGQSAATQIRIGPDLGPEPWHVQIESSDRILACAL